jgi:hypothetical protein
MRASTPLPDLPAVQSCRTALILDRFSVNCTVTYYSNHRLVTPAAATTRTFFDFVALQDEAVVRSWLEVIKTCGVNDRGHPSDGGFGYGRFLLCPEGRDSMCVLCFPMVVRNLSPPQCLGASSNAVHGQMAESVACADPAGGKHSSHLSRCDFLRAFGWACLYSATCGVKLCFLSRNSFSQPFSSALTPQCHDAQQLCPYGHLGRAPIHTKSIHSVLNVFSLVVTVKCFSSNLTHQRISCCWRQLSPTAPANAHSRRRCANVKDSYRERKERLRCARRSSSRYGAVWLSIPHDIALLPSCDF